MSNYIPIRDLNIVNTDESAAGYSGNILDMRKLIQKMISAKASDRSSASEVLKAVIKVTIHESNSIIRDFKIGTMKLVI